MNSRTATAVAIGNEEYGAMNYGGDSGRGSSANSTRSKGEKILTFKKADGDTETVVVNHSLTYRIIKRTFDILLSLVALIVLSPVFLITAIAIKSEDHGSCIFKQERSGLDGTVFSMYKFRSMRVGAAEEHKDLVKFNELDGPAFKMKNDPRITRVGRVIRKTSIDELPQIWNVLKGEMSLVGPRPLPVYETEELDIYQRQRLSVKPGLTCYWQVSGRCDVPFQEWMELDVAYVKDASVLTDIKIIFKTFGAVMSGQGAV